MKRLRRWYWTWRFNVWRRRLVRREAELDHFTPEYFGSAFADDDKAALQRRVNYAKQMLQTYERLLGTDMPKLRLIQGGKSDAG